MNQKEIDCIAIEVEMAHNNVSNEQLREERYSDVAKRYLVGMYDQKNEENDTETSVSDTNETDVDEDESNNRGLSVWSEGPKHLKASDENHYRKSLSVNMCAEGDHTRLGFDEQMSPTYEGDMDVDDIDIEDDSDERKLESFDGNSDDTEVIGEDMDVDDIQL